MQTAEKSFAFAGQFCLKKIRSREGDFPAPERIFAYLEKVYI